MRSRHAALLAVALLVGCDDTADPDAGIGDAGVLVDAGDVDGGASGDAGTASAGQILAAYHGLDMLPAAANLLCAGVDAAGEGGMPVVFSVQVSSDSVSPEAFRVETADGTQVTPVCATLNPANEENERRTVLLAGPFGTATDAPRAVAVVGDLRDVEGASLMGVRTDAIVPLADGPSLALAERFEPNTSGFEGECAAGAQIVQLTWEGGVTGPGGAALGEAQRSGVEVTLEGGDTVVPVSLGDDDPDNHVVACVDDARPAISVSVAAGLFHDPGDDPNPATRADVVAR